MVHPRRYILVVCTLLIGFSCSGYKKESQTISVTNDGNGHGTPEITFEKDVHAFGELVSGEKVAYAFQYTNTGDGNLIINDVKASCGCTTPEWDNHPIKPGQKGTIQLIFDSSGRSGEQFKTIKIFANTTKKEHTLAITANVKTNV